MADTDDNERPANGWTNRSIYELLREMDRRYAGEFRAVRELIAAADKRYEQRFLAQEKAVDSALVEREKAVIKAEIAAEKRFDTLAETFSEKLDVLTSSRDSFAGYGRGVTAVWAVIVGAATVLGATVAAFVAASHAFPTPTP